MIILQDILSQEIVQRLGWTLLHFIWQAAAVTLILAILLRLLRKSTANLRYISACLALAMIVLLPVITIRLVPVSAPQPVTHIEPAPVTTVLPAIEMPAPETIVIAKPSQPESVTPVPAIPFKQRAVDTLEPTLPYIVSGWLIGVFGLSIWHLGGWTQLQRLKRRMVKQVDSTLLNKLKVSAQRLKVKQTVRLMESALVQIPTVVGWLRPVILLPASALTGLSSEQLEAIIAHELAHIKRFDYFINILQTIVEILGFYHPSVWWVSYKIRAERENCCDDMAVSISGDRISYAGALASMEEIRAGRGKLAVAATGGNLFRRVCRLLGNDPADNTGLSWVPAVTAILLIIALAIPTTLALTDKSDSLLTEPETKVQVEDDISIAPALDIESLTENIPPAPVLAKSPAPSDKDKAHIKVNCLVVEVSLDSKIDTETLAEAEKLLGSKISLRNTKVDVILRKAIKATTATKDESAENKRITEKQFIALVEMLTSKGYMKILMKPTLQVVDGQTAKLIGTVNPLKESSLEITPHVFADGDIILEVKAGIRSQDIPAFEAQTPVSLRQIASRMRVNPGESMIMGGLTENLPTPGDNLKNTEKQANEVLFIITPTIITPATDSQEKTDVRIESKEAMVYLVYDISDLVETAADADALIRRITTTIQPDSWYKPSDTGYATIIAYPVRQPKKFAVMQTHKIHQKITRLLEDIRRSQSEQKKTKPATERRRRPARSIDDSIAKIDNKDQVVQKLFKLKHHNSSQVAQIVRPLLSHTGHISADERTNSLLVTDTVENLKRIELIITEYDVSKAGQTVTEIFEIRYANPVEIVELLKKLINGPPGFGSIIEPGKEPIVLIPEPMRKWIIAKASPEDMKQIGEWIKKLDISKSIGMDPADAAVYEQLETIVDLSDLAPGMSFGEVVDKLENSVEPPVQIQPIWKDLLENAEVEQATPAGMDPLTRIKLRKALEILIAGVTSSQLGELAELTYVVDEGIILIGTVDMLPPKMVHRVYDISDLVVTAADADALIRRITEKIEPDSWYGLSNKGEGTIMAYPALQPKKFAVMQTYKIHQQIKRFLDDIRSRSEKGKIQRILDDIISSRNEQRKTKEHEQQPSQVQPKENLELTEITTRMDSGKKLSNLGKALLIYANDHDDKYPNSLHHLPVYSNVEELKWALANVKYLAHGKTLADRPDTVIAYDKKLLREGKGTNVLYNDCHVGFEKAEELKKLGISREIMIETQLWSVSEDFLKAVGLDANSANLSDAWTGHLAAKYSSKPNSETFGLIIDDLHLSFLLKTFQAHHDSKALIAPRVLCREGTTAEMGITTEEYHYVTGYNEPNSPSDKPQPKLEKVEIGTRIWLTPELTDDNRNISLDLKLEMRQLKGIIEGKYKGKYPYHKPIIDVINIKTPCIIPDGKTMLIGGLKITEQIKKEPGAPLLNKLPVMGKLLHRPTTTTEQKMLLVLVKPVLNPQQKATKVLPGQEDSEEHIQRLAEQLEKKLKRPAEHK